MKISIIVALTKNRVIGKDNTIPWNISEDLSHFKKVTLGKPIIMGRKTFQSLNYKPLKDRKNIVLTSQKKLFVDRNDIEAVNSVQDALALCEEESEVMVIGGAKVYEDFLPFTDRLYLSLIHEEYEGDTYFPDYSTYKWTEIAKEKKEEFTIVMLERKKKEAINLQE